MGAEDSGETKSGGSIGTQVEGFGGYPFVEEEEGLVIILVYKGSPCREVPPGFFCQVNVVLGELATYG